MGNITEMLSGVFAPITAPFDENEEFDAKSLEYNVLKYEKTKLQGYVLVGSNGENKSLSESEKRQTVELVAKKSNKVIIIGVMYESQKHAIEFIKDTAKLGANFALVQSPGYFAKKMTDEILEQFFTTVADESPIPIILYNSPGFNGVTLSYNLISKLREHKNIIGMKDSSADGMEKNIELERNDFHVMAGSVNTMFPAMLKGSIGGTISVANYLPELGAKLWKLGNDKNDIEGQIMHDKLVQFNKNVSGAYGVSGVKAAMDIVGYKGGAPRLPLPRLNEKNKQELKIKLIEAENI